MHKGFVPSAILLDLDGTLVDSFAAIRASVNHVRAIHSLPALSLAAVKSSVGNGLTRLLELTCPGADPREDAARFITHHETVLERATTVLPGVRRTLTALSRRGCRLGVCSNKPVELSRQLLRAVRLDSLFDVVLGPESVPHRKPAPDMVLAAIKELGVTPQTTLYVGDMTIDIETGRAAGVPVWVIPSGSQSREILEAAKPDRILTQFRELLEVRT